MFFSQPKRTHDQIEVKTAYFKPRMVKKRRLTIPKVSLTKCAICFDLLVQNTPNQLAHPECLKKKCVSEGCDKQKMVCPRCSLVLDGFCNSHVKNSICSSCCTGLPEDSQRPSFLQVNREKEGDIKDTQFPPTHVFLTFPDKKERWVCLAPPKKTFWQDLKSGLEKLKQKCRNLLNPRAFINHQPPLAPSRLILARELPVESSFCQLSCQSNIFQVSKITGPSLWQRLKSLF